MSKPPVMLMGESFVGEGAEAARSEPALAQVFRPRPNPANPFYESK